MERDAYARDAATVARTLLGCTLVHGPCRGRIVETEAYRGRSDPASHAANGRTDRNAAMYGEPGRSYVYLCYGIHTMLNTVTGRTGLPSAVLIRAVEPLEGEDTMHGRRGVDDSRDLCNGPGKLCEAFAITQDYDGEDLLEGNLRIVDGPTPDSVQRTPRIGISTGEDRPLRFLDPESPHTSRTGDVTTGEL